MGVLTYHSSTSGMEVVLRPNSHTQGTVPQNSLGPDRFGGLSCWSPRIPGSEPIIPGGPHTCHIPLLKISLQMVRTTRIEAM